MTELKDILKCQGVKSCGYGIVGKLVMQDKRITRDAKAIYAYFCSFAGSGNTAFPSVEKMCYDLGFKKYETFRKHFKLLVEYDYIKVQQKRGENGKFNHNIYTLVDKPNPEIENKASKITVPQKMGNGDFTDTHFTDTRKKGYPQKRVSVNWGPNINNTNKINNKDNISFIHSKKYVDIDSENEASKENEGMNEISINSLNNKFDEDFYYQLLENLRLDNHFQTDTKIMIEQAIVHLLQERSDVPLSVLKEHLMYLNVFDIERAIKNFRNAKNVKSPLAYLAKCIYRAGVENKAEIENYLSYLSTKDDDNNENEKKVKNTRNLNYLEI